MSCRAPVQPHPPFSAILLVFLPSLCTLSKFFGAIAQPLSLTFLCFFFFHLRLTLRMFTTVRPTGASFLRALYFILNLSISLARAFAYRVSTLTCPTHFRWEHKNEIWARCGWRRICIHPGTNKQLGAVITSRQIRRK